jgi:hypothetical protein
MQEDKTPVSKNMIERNPYDISSDEDEDQTSLVLPSLLKQLKLLTLVKPCKLYRRSTSFDLQ